MTKCRETAGSESNSAEGMRTERNFTRIEVELKQTCGSDGRNFRQVWNKSRYTGSKVWRRGYQEDPGGRSGGMQQLQQQQGPPGSLGVAKPQASPPEVLGGPTRGLETSPIYIGSGAGIVRVCWEILLVREPRLILCWKVLLVRDPGLISCWKLPVSGLQMPWKLGVLGTGLGEVRVPVEITGSQPQSWGPGCGPLQDQSWVQEPVGVDTSLAKPAPLRASSSVKD
jgi:hypothetical protein